MLLNTMDKMLRTDLAVNWHPLLSHERALAGVVLAMTGWIQCY